MNIYVTNLETKEEFQFPMLPEKISVQTETAFQSYDIMSIGEVKFPMGANLTAFSWEGILPGKLRMENFLRASNPTLLLKAWDDPKAIQSMWSFWRHDKTKLELFVTETPIKHDVYLESYSVDYKGGFGDYYYSIKFVQAKELKVYSESETQESNSTVSTDNPRPEPPQAKTYTVVNGDCLWKIAQRTLGNGSRYPEIHSINQPPMGSNPDVLQVGWVLKLP